MPTATPSKPVSQATSYTRKLQGEELARLGAFLLIVGWLLLPHLPSPIMGVDWRGFVLPMVSILFMPFPPAEIGLPLPIPRWPLLQWLNYALGGFLAFIALTLLAHLLSLYAQRIRPLGLPRTYLQVLVPLAATTTPGSGGALIRSLYGMLPRSNPRQPTGAPLVLRWTAQPERRIRYGVSVLGPPTLVTQLEKRLLGINTGTKVLAIPDPLLAELKPGRWLCVADVQTALSDEYPIAPIGKESLLLDSLLPAMAPQAGVKVADAQIILEPLPDRLWRLRVQALQERLKIDLGLEEIQALKAKAAGPAFRTTIRLLAVADDPAAGTAMVQTMGSAFAASAQGIATQEQRLVVGPVQVLPAIVEPPPPFPPAQCWAGLMLGIAMSGGMVFLIQHVDVSARGLSVWALPLLLVWLPLLALAVRWRARVRAELPVQVATVTGSVPPPQNPRSVPIWWPWLGWLR